MPGSFPGSRAALGLLWLTGEPGGEGRPADAERRLDAVRRHADPAAVRGEPETLHIRTRFEVRADAAWDFG